MKLCPSCGKLRTEFTIDIATGRRICLECHFAQPGACDTDYLEARPLTRWPLSEAVVARHNIRPLP
jgi:hypothetical protein